jgi:hypothetical protein
MKNFGWHTKPGVKILEGKWQDFVGSEELLAVGGFDVVYTDTFSEDYTSGYNGGTISSRDKQLILSYRSIAPVLLSLARPPRRSGI